MILKEYGPDDPEKDYEESEQDTKEYENIEISDEDAEEIIEKYHHLIEKGLTYLEHQLRPDNGKRIEALFADSCGTLVAVVLKTEGSEDAISESLDYYNNIIRNMDTYSRVFNEKFSSLEIDTTRRPRLFIITPVVDFELMEKCKWLDIDITAFAFRCVRNIYSNSIVPVFLQIPIPEIPKTLTAEEMEKMQDAKDIAEESSSETEENESQERPVAKEISLYFDIAPEYPIVEKADDYEKLRRESPSEEDELDIPEDEEFGRED